jgi:hypothetical protein
MAEREVRSIAYHMKAARFPAYKDIQDKPAEAKAETLLRYVGMPTDNM